MSALQLSDPKGTFDGNGRQAVSDESIASKFFWLFIDFMAIYRFVAIFRICLKICNLIPIKGLESFSNPG